MGEQEVCSALTKQIKPNTDVQRDLTQSIINEIIPIRDGIHNIPKVIMYPSIQSIESDEEKSGKIGDIAVSNWRKFATKNADKTYEI